MVYYLLQLVELKKLEEEGFGVYVDKNRMEQDKIFPIRNCFAAFVKKDILDLPDKFFDMTKSSDCNRDLYVSNYDRDMDINMKKVTAVYHADKHRLTISLETNMSTSKLIFFFHLRKVFYISIRNDKTSSNENITNFIFSGSASNKIKELNMAMKRKFGYKTPDRNALDDLASAVRKEKELECPAGFAKEDMASSEEDIEDLVFQRNILPDRTGVFDIDFPESPKVSKGKGKRSSVSRATKNSDKIQRDVAAISSGLHPSTDVTDTSKDTSEVDEGSENNELDIHGNIRPSGVSTSQNVNLKPNTSDESERDITDTEIIQVAVKSKKCSLCFNMYILFYIIFAHKFHI